MGTNRERFERVSQKRLDNTIKQINLISNLCDKSNYSYRYEEIEAIFERLQEALDDAKLRCMPNKLTAK